MNSVGCECFVCKTGRVLSSVYCQHGFQVIVHYACTPNHVRAVATSLELMPQNLTVVIAIPLVALGDGHISTTLKEISLLVNGSQLLRGKMCFEKKCVGLCYCCCSCSCSYRYELLYQHILQKERPVSP
jgi:hypothetical protein